MYVFLRHICIEKSAELQGIDKKRKVPKDLNVDVWPCL